MISHIVSLRVPVSIALIKSLITDHFWPIHWLMTNSLIWELLTSQQVPDCSLAPKTFRMLKYFCGISDRICKMFKLERANPVALAESGLNSLFGLKWFHLSQIVGISNNPLAAGLWRQHGGRKHQTPGGGQSLTRWFGGVSTGQIQMQMSSSNTWS